MGIQPAEPEQGLRTGSVQGAEGGLETGAVGAREMVAKEYERDLSGKNGALARFDAIDEIAQKRIEMSFKEMTFGSAGGDVQIFGMDGKFAVRAKRGGLAGTVASRLPTKTIENWDLIVQDAKTGTVKVNCGTIIKDASDLSTALTITNEDTTFSPSGTNKYIYLKFADLTTPTCTLTSGGNWTDYPSSVEVTGTGASAAYTAYYYPLFHFVTTATDGYKRIKDTLFFKKLVSDTNFLLVHAIYQAGSDAPLVVHNIIPYHAVLP